ncbi:YdeI/OmpD-associated family protein [Roseinatronobacter alkalisoli]|uniref:YdeI/OmpD-associated family protein n=1 Tax=Roseinatronobacter alkalisoli TaxID=3028235 RepID=A0ABT5T6R2_9RHOB|nr:YdeI/OmpD-associated family protein [Roseinatronobacter sp. HJB301]MDD7970812.1 YdeI/OmpD-associated family protein [Roseinatronobacter sp. HJB301]
MSNISTVATLLAKPDWHDERRMLRSLALDSGLEEHVKWGKLCYSHTGSNVAIIFGMKDFCALGFFKGSLLEDTAGHLVAPGQHSQAMRQLRFKNLDQIREHAHSVTAFIEKAIQAEKDGLQVDFSAKHNLHYPDEFQDALDHDPELAEAFWQLTPGRQRGYVLHIADARQSETRIRRIDKWRDNIIKGRGLTDR